MSLVDVMEARCKCCAALRQGAGLCGPDAMLAACSSGDAYEIDLACCCLGWAHHCAAVCAINDAHGSRRQRGAEDADVVLRLRKRRLQDHDQQPAGSSLLQ